MTRSMFSGSISGSSPWTFTTIVASVPSTAARTRSVPDGRSGAVITAVPPACLTTAAIRSSSVATRTASARRDFRA